MFDWEAIAEYYRQQAALKAQRKAWSEAAEKLKLEAARRKQRYEQQEVRSEELRKIFGLPRTSPVTGKYLPPRDNAGAIPRIKHHKLFKRDHYTCQICGRVFKEWQLQPNHIDHDRKHNAISNLETTCAACNAQEGKVYSKLLNEAGPRSEVTESERLKIVERARAIVKEQARER